MLANRHGVINVSINSSYRCQARCAYCYLTEKQLSSRDLLDLTLLDKRLGEIQASGHRIDHADLYGGEVLLYPKGYMQETKALLHARGIREIEVITNLMGFNEELLQDPDWGINVSFDFQFRERHEEVYRNMLRLERPFGVLTLATPEVVTLEADHVLQQLSLLRHLHYFEVKPYSTSQANQTPMSYRLYEDFIQRLITSPVPKHYRFSNEEVLQDALEGLRNAFSDDHVYVTPSGRFGVLEFDLNDHEYFLELDSFTDYLKWCLIEKSRVYDRSLCGSCEFSGKCLSEHLRRVTSFEDSCNGFRNLLLWGKTHYNQQPAL